MNVVSFVLKYAEIAAAAEAFYSAEICFICQCYVEFCLALNTTSIKLSLLKSNNAGWPSNEPIFAWFRMFNCGLKIINELLEKITISLLPFESKSPTKG